ncbi:Zinc finger protein 37 [Trachymyrmex septentrionalis]|uniref:Zinc finger protein 37 n=2 Tax=Trachymyrmex septentrionalis TaxID=34720 RepID=A0A195FU56_9HYME|nr:PREDICTED: putative histone-lysine N-methyltransferase 1 isoform X2 [Trachymyrmex septentrionalis]XP_018356716.1 PREDICTED: putative histone-lysine N-methyltransferase 1 isoform X2 [Trachymyrmex septentrionalis]XP_018356717.1 PREDICTED: putative histone-lysine N-methyltransferase 1 isoform X2 [Trachymyrmex septentrionalis]KYN43419.1 Zinc finger protein 37 [Trachymyrmex septentrionalis]
MQAQNCNNTRKKMNIEVGLSSMKSFKTIFMKDANISEEKTIANQASLHNVQLLRNLPNILRSNNTKTSRNHKILNKTDTSISGAEDGNSSWELNTSSSVDLDMEVNYNKITLSKSHHQRKQVHNPLDVQYDIPDCNNNKNKNLLQEVSQLNTLNISPSCQKNTPTKKKNAEYNNKQKKSLFNKNLKKKTTHKSSRKTQVSRKKPVTLATIPDMNMKNAMQDVNNFLKNDILPQQLSIYNSNFSNINVNDLNNVATDLVEPSNIFYCNNEIYKFDKECDINLNDVISCKPTEINTTQSKTIQKDITSYEFPITENNLQRKTIDSYIGSNFLCGSKILYSCSCANCMSHDKDIIFYEDPVSTSSSSDDMEAELFTCDLHTNIYDFYINNYFHIFGNLMDFEKNFYEEFDENISTKENACSTTEVIENSTNMSSINQNESQNLQPSHIDRKDICVESYPAAFVTYPNEITMENSRTFDEIDIPNYLNLDSFSMKENKMISQDEILIQNAVSSNAPVSNSTYQIPENNRDLYVMQCAQCGKLFSKKHQLWKHFSHCYFYKENFPCHICNKMYRHKSSLVQHLRLVHNVSHGLHEKLEKNYICKKCSKSYVRFRAFQRHMLLHDD